MWMALWAADGLREPTHWSVAAPTLSRETVARLTMARLPLDAALVTCPIYFKYADIRVHGDLHCHTSFMMPWTPRVQVAFGFTLLMSVFVIVSIALRAQAIVNIATVAGTLISATALYLSLAAEPTEEKINSAIVDLAEMLEDSWGSRMIVLLGLDEDRPAGSRARPASVRFSRVPDLELTSQTDLGSDGIWDTVYLAFYKEIKGGRLVIAGDPGYGKTLLAIELVLQILRARKTDSSPESQLPVPVSVAGWDGAESLPIWLARRLKDEWHLSPAISRILIRRHPHTPRSRWPGRDRSTAIGGKPT
jgi:hypothetical protein